MSVSMAGDGGVAGDGAGPGDPSHGVLDTL